MNYSSSPILSLKLLHLPKIFPIKQALEKIIDSSGDSFSSLLVFLVHFVAAPLLKMLHLLKVCPTKQSTKKSFSDYPAISSPLPLVNLVHFVATPPS
jgi:hypothetical protein